MTRIIVRLVAKEGKGPIVKGRASNYCFAVK
jgi:hypothetical protein